MLDWPRGTTRKARDQRAERRADVAADLKDRLRQAVTAAGRHPRDARRLRVKDRRTDAHQSGSRPAASAKLPAHRQPDSPTAVNPMPTTSEYGVGRRSVTVPTAGCSSDDVICCVERDQADLREAERERRLEQRIDGGQQRLDGVVQQMREADRGQDGNRRDGPSADRDR